MVIANEIDRVEREFVSGEVLLLAVMAQESLNELHAASWFMRNINKLDELPMLQFNATLRDFRLIPVPWASDVFSDLAVGALGGNPVDWDEDGDGYVGGWLASDLRRFFGHTRVAYPETDIARLTATEDLPLLRPTQLRRSALEVGDYLAARGRDYIEVSDWLEALGPEVHAVGMALRIAFDELGAIVPLYYLDTFDNPDLPIPVAELDAAVIWSDILIALSMDEIPDCLFGDGPGHERWMSSFFVRGQDCAFFASRTGLGKKRFFKSPHAGHLQTVTLDLAGARDRSRMRDKEILQERATEQIKSGTDTPASEDRPMTSKERDNLLRIIGGLVELMLGESPAGKKLSVFASQDAIITALENNFPTSSGLKERNLQAKFAEGKRLIQAS